MGIFRLFRPNVMKMEEKKILKVRIRGQATCYGEGTYAAAEFNNRYGDGFYVKLWDVQGVLYTIIVYSSSGKKEISSAKNLKINVKLE